MELQVKPLPELLRCAALLSLLGACAFPGLSGLGGPRSTTTLDLDGSMRLARASLAAGDVDSGIGLLRQTVQAHPDDLQAKRALAEAYYQIGAYPEAGLAFADLSKADPGSADGPVGLGRIALARGDATEAASQFSRALERSPEDGRAWNGLAVARDYAGAHAEAQEIYHRLLAKNPADRAVANNLAVSAALAGDPGRAIADLSELADGPARLPQARFNLALAYGMTGDLKSAQDVLGRALDRRELAENLAFYQALATSDDPATH